MGIAVIFELAAVFVPLLPGGLEIKNKILGIEPELREGLLNERKDAAAPFESGGGAVISVFEAGFQLGGELPDQIA